MSTPDPTDEQVLAVLLDDVERTPAVAAAEPGNTPATVSPGRKRRRGAAAAAAAGAPWVISGRTIDEAHTRAREQHGEVVVLGGYRSRTWWGAPRVTLEVGPRNALSGLSRPAPGTGGGRSEGGVRRGAADDGEVVWSRDGLRRLGVPAEFLRRLPVEDPSSAAEWEALLQRMLFGVLMLADRSTHAAVDGWGPRGAAALIRAAECGLPMGRLDGESPVTSELLLRGLREGMPRRGDATALAAPGQAALEESALAVEGPADGAGDQEASAGVTLIEPDGRPEVADTPASGGGAGGARVERESSLAPESVEAETGGGEDLGAPTAAPAPRRAPQSGRAKGAGKAGATPAESAPKKPQGRSSGKRAAAKDAAPTGAGEEPGAPRARSRGLRGARLEGEG